MDVLCIFVFFSLSMYTTISAAPGRHSLRLFATYIMGETPFPHFTAVLMVDNIQVGYFDSKNKTFYNIGPQQEKQEDKTGYLKRYVFEEKIVHMRERLIAIKDQFNLTKGLHVYQQITACGTTAGEESDFVMFRDSMDAIDVDGLHCDKSHFSYWAGNTYNATWNEKQNIIYQTVFPNIYLPLCITTLKHFLEKNKDVILRKLHPKVRFLQKEIPGGAQLSCLATDFYPRNINLTLLRDGKPVADNQLTGGSVLPNGNGLYQVRKSLELSTEDLRERHNYTCVASHLSVDNNVVNWQTSGGRSLRLPVLSGRLLLGLLLIALLLVGLGCWKLKTRCQQCPNMTNRVEVEQKIEDSF